MPKSATVSKIVSGTGSVAKEIAIKVALAIVVITIAALAAIAGLLHVIANAVQ